MLQCESGSEIHYPHLKVIYVFIVFIMTCSEGQSGGDIIFKWPSTYAIVGHVRRGPDEVRVDDYFCTMMHQHSFDLICW